LRPVYLTFKGYLFPYQVMGNIQALLVFSRQPAIPKRWTLKNMEPLQQQIRVSFSYPVYFTRNLFAPDNQLLKAILGEAGPDFPKKLLAVIDQGVCAHHPRLIPDLEAYGRTYPDFCRLADAPLVVSGGEGVKNDPQTLTQVHRAVHDTGLCRHSYIMAVGGGAVIDMVGLAAATAHRGIRLIRVPRSWPRPMPPSA